MEYPTMSRDIFLAVGSHVPPKDATSRPVSPNSGGVAATIPGVYQMSQGEPSRDVARVSRSRHPTKDSCWRTVDLESQHGHDAETAREPADLPTWTRGVPFVKVPTRIRS